MRKEILAHICHSEWDNGEGIVRVRGRRRTEAPDRVGRHVRAHGRGFRACEAYGRVVVEEVRGATEG